ncbi:MAG: hypothetical protein M3O70_21675, partial [Actinomycetota bacterium]|nr:hypothetical protein [Actinomycetota bacterium]
PTGGQAMGYQSKSAAYRAATRGDLPTIRLGKRKLVCPTWRLLELLEVEEPSNGNGAGANPLRQVVDAATTPSLTDTATATGHHSVEPHERGGGGG